MTSSDEIRRSFTDFFVERGHLAVPSASLVPSALDQSVLLTTAGMQPFKPYFLGQATPPAARMTSIQRCFRAVDIDVVGSTDRHLTFFQMMGNFSFGDYFKPGAVEMAYELSTGGWGLDPERIWATVYEGDDQIGPDDVARDLWLAQGIPASRIVALGEDNFWKAGPTGPCGPCSELYYDRGVQLGCGRAVASRAATATASSSSGISSSWSSIVATTAPSRLCLHRTSTPAAASSASPCSCREQPACSRPTRRGT